MLGRIRDLIGHLTFPLVEGSSSVQISGNGWVVKYHHPTPFVRLTHLLARGHWRHPYENLDWLKLAQLRRQIANLVLQFEMGDDSRDWVAPINYIDDFSSRGLTTHCPFVAGETLARNRHNRQFLDEVTQIFQKAGLPTWQINARFNPRAWTNVILSAEGRYTIIDLESQIVSPFVPFSEWWAAWRKGRLVPFDEIDFQHLWAYQNMIQARGWRKASELYQTIQKAEDLEKALLMGQKPTQSIERGRL